MEGYNMADSIENLLDNINSLDNANSDVVVLDNLNGTVDPYVIDNIGSDNVINVTEEIIVPETPITTDNGQMFVYVTKSTGSNDYHTLENKPSINGVTLIGNKTSEDLKLYYVHEQAIASATWEINHNLGRYPSVTVVDSAGDKVETLTHYVDENNIRLEFTAEFGGKAYLN